MLPRYLLHISAWASALLVYCERQCEKPQIVGRATSKTPTLFCANDLTPKRDDCGTKIQFIMKKCLPKLLLLIIGMLIGTNAHAYDFEVDGIYYNINDDGTSVEVTYKDYNYNSYSGNVIIPETVKHNDIIYRVTSIGFMSFFRSSSLISIIIPNSVTSIGNYAFIDCVYLTSVTIGSGVTSIGQRAFSECDNLTDIYISDIAKWCDINFEDHFANPLRYAKNLYLNGNLVTDLVIPESVTIIKNYAFSGCTSLTSITLGCNVSIIDQYAFSNCVFSQITIPDSVTKIGDYAFVYCRSLRSLTLGNGLSEIGSYAFCSCGLSSVIVPNSVTKIGDYAFAYCTGLTSITIGSAITSIGYCAFKGSDVCNVVDINQTSCKLQCHAIQNIISVNHQEINNGYVSLTNLKPGTTYRIYLQVKMYNGNIIDLYINDFSTISLHPRIIHTNISPTSISCEFSYIVGNAEITGREVACDSGNLELNKDTATITGLDPDTQYAINYTVKSINDYFETATYAFTTPQLTMTTLPAEATSNTVAVIAAETNLSDEETGAGFEWRRYDAPDLVPSTLSSCPIVDGKLMGALNNLSANTYYKYRPYYTSASGTTYYGDWLAFGTADAYVYFEPMVRTYSATGVTFDGANVKAYVVAGSDEITSQGFEYWMSGNTMNSMRIEAVPSMGVQTVEASGQWMNVTLSGLKEDSEYTYRAYVTTAKGTTYGEEQSFTTAKGAGINDIIADEQGDVIEVARYTIDGSIITKPQRGINIVRYSDGSVRKVIVK